MKNIFKNLQVSLYVFILIFICTFLITKYTGISYRADHSSTGSFTWSESTQLIPLCIFAAIIASALTFYFLWANDKNENRKK